MDVSDCYRDWRDEAMKSWTRMLSSTVESTAFIEAVSASTTNVLDAQQQARQVQAATLRALDVPTRKVLAGLAARAQRAELRALQNEERAEALLERLQHLSKQLGG